MKPNQPKILQEKPKPDKKDKKDYIIVKYVQEHKILKLIDRMCNGEFLNTSQFDTVFEYIKKKGHSSTIQEEWYCPVWEKGELIRHDKEIREAPGYRYLGVFAKVENTDKVLIYGDTRQNRIVYVRQYPSGQTIIR